MAFVEAQKREKVKRTKRIGVVKQATKHDGLYLKIDSQCDLILYCSDTGEYFKVLKVPVEVEENGNVVFSLDVNLDSDKQVELKARD